ncbi:MAG: 50S ribosomal protein L20 [candidate division TM6 bacterium GW2011_GWE2_41_16]|nr:MAG: 50S ribosomal protein L20 [candidate division TM6 bacterium GW2011_GWE2_41_16]
MSRIKRGMMTKKRHKRVLKAAKGFWGQRGNIFRRAAETLRRAMAFAFVGRKLKKRDMRSLFITRVSAAAKARGMKYNTLIHGLKLKHVELDRKMLSQIAIFDSAAFDSVVALAKK